LCVKKWKACTSSPCRLSWKSESVRTGGIWSDLGNSPFYWSTSSTGMFLAPSWLHGCRIRVSSRSSPVSIPATVPSKSQFIPSGGCDADCPCLLQCDRTRRNFIRIRKTGSDPGKAERKSAARRRCGQTCHCGSQESGNADAGGPLCREENVWLRLRDVSRSRGRWQRRYGRVHEAYDERLARSAVAQRDDGWRVV